MCNATTQRQLAELNGGGGGGGGGHPGAAPPACQANAPAGTLFGIAVPPQAFDALQQAYPGPCSETKIIADVSSKINVEDIAKQIEEKLKSADEWFQKNLAPKLREIAKAAADLAADEIHFAEQTYNKGVDKLCSGAGSVAESLGSAFGISGGGAKAKDQCTKGLKDRFNKTLEDKVSDFIEHKMTPAVTGFIDKRVPELLAQVQVTWLPKLLHIVTQKANLTDTALDPIKDKLWDVFARSVGTAVDHVKHALVMTILQPFIDEFKAKLPPRK
jgi:hypothetical protein